jgi:hypothetical protein
LTGAANAILRGCLRQFKSLGQRKVGAGEHN